MPYFRAPKSRQSARRWQAQEWSDGEGQ